MIEPDNGLAVRLVIWASIVALIAAPVGVLLLMWWQIP